MGWEKKNYVVIIVKPDGSCIATIQRKEPSLKQLQEAVDGPIQMIPHFSRLAIKDSKKKTWAYERGTCYANEEGKLPHKQLVVNAFATQMWKGQYAYVDQWLVGNIVYVARTTEEVQD
jgi:hypothetical protein